MKKCKECKQTKQFSEFNVQNGCADGFGNQCKSCISIILLNKRRTKRGLVKGIYANQKRRSKKRGHSQPTYTLEELIHWFNNHPLANALYDAWRLSGYRRGLVPSVDRLDDSVGYSFDNIQLLTWSENDSKGCEDRKSGRMKKCNNEAVVQRDKKGKFISRYHSQHDASRITNISQTSISLCCSGKQYSAGGFLWEKVVV